MHLWSPYAPWAVVFVQFDNFYLFIMKLVLLVERVRVSQENKFIYLCVHGWLYVRLKMETSQWFLFYMTCFWILGVQNQVWNRLPCCYQWCCVSLRPRLPVRPIDFVIDRDKSWFFTLFTQLTFLSKHLLPRISKCWHCCWKYMHWLNLFLISFRVRIVVHHTT